MENNAQVDEHGELVHGLNHELLLVPIVVTEVIVSEVQVQHDQKAFKLKEVKNHTDVLTDGAAILLRQLNLIPLSSWF